MTDTKKDALKTLGIMCIEKYGFAAGLSVRDQIVSALACPEPWGTWTDRHGRTWNTSEDGTYLVDNGPDPRQTVGGAR